MLRIGVTDGLAVQGASGSGAASATDSDARLEIQGVASWSLAELAGVHEGTLPELFGWKNVLIRRYLKAEHYGSYISYFIGDLCSEECHSVSLSFIPITEPITEPMNCVRGSTTW